jgi:hypothetical protein
MKKSKLYTLLRNTLPWYYQKEEKLKFFRVLDYKRKVSCCAIGNDKVNV